MLFACFALLCDPQATRTPGPSRVSTTAPASHGSVVRSNHTTTYSIYSSRHAEMNWTGGQLRRHSARQGILSKTQKQSFATSRQQASERVSRQPSTFRGVPDPKNGGDDRLDSDATCRNGQMTGGEAQNLSVVLLTFHRCWPRPTLSPSSRVVALTLDPSRASAPHPRVCFHWPGLFPLTALAV